MSSNTIKPADASRTYHSRYCALQNLKVAPIFFLFSAVQFFLRLRELSHPSPAEEESIIFYVGVLTAIACLVDLFIALKCWRERLVLGLAIASLTSALLARSHLISYGVDSPLMTWGQAVLWGAALAVTCSMVLTCIRNRRTVR